MTMRKDAKPNRARLKLKAQILSGEEIAFGPGKADLLDAIDKAGSISGGARLMGLSYRRAWLLVDTMNRCFREPLVESGRGGNDRGGAKVTAFGKTILSRYRALQRALDKASLRHGQTLMEALKPHRPSAKR